jgi:hypothetical protein
MHRVDFFFFQILLQLLGRIGDIAAFTPYFTGDKRVFNGGGVFKTVTIFGN